MCVSVFVCPAMRFAPLRPMGMKLRMVVGGGQGPIISEGHQRSKVRSNFKLLGLSSNLGRVMLVPGRVQNAYRGGCPPRSSEVKGQVKFQVARIELRLGEGDARPKASAKCVSRRTPSRVK